ncbi:MAG: efflux RND transporter periplasmic adaptor subunit [Pirellulales bacterium]
MRKWVLVAVAIAGLGAAGLGFASWNFGVPVEAARVQRGAVREYVDEEGKTRLAETYLVTMPYDGRIEPIDSIEGTHVSQGQVVARIKAVDIDLKKALARAAVERLKASIKENDDASVENTALSQTVSMVESIDRTVEAAATRVKTGEAKLEYSEKYLSRVQRLTRNNTATEDELDRARLSQVEASVQYQQDVLVLRAAEALRAATALFPTAVRQYIQRKVLTHDVLEQQLAEAEVQMREAEKDERLGAMTSPVDGVVLERPVTNERQLAAGTVLLKIGRFEDLEIEADVLSQDVVRVKPGQSVEVHGAAIGERSARAEVTRIYPAGFTKVSSLGVEQQRVKVIMKFAPEDWQRLRSERDLGVDYRVRVRIFTAEATGALVAPRSALFRGAQNAWQLFAVRSGRARLQTVKVGLANDESAEILGGLAENDLVVLAPETNLTDGQRVRVLPTADGEAR